MEATQGSGLKDRVEKVVKRHDMKIKVVERGGRTMTSLLQRSDPFGRNLCDKQDCIICLKGFKVNCIVRGCVYQLRYLECICRLYRGQTS